MFSSNGGFEGGYSYSPYGEARSTSTNVAAVANVMRYIGSPLDSSGLYKLGARYYDPSVGRFAQFDPSGQEPNPYGYTAANPTNSSDATGLELDWESIGYNTVAAASGAIIGAAVEVALLPLCVGVVTCIGTGLLSAAAGEYLGSETADLVYGY